MCAVRLVCVRAEKVGAPFLRCSRAVTQEYFSVSLLIAIQAAALISRNT